MGVSLLLLAISVARLMVIHQLTIECYRPPTSVVKKILLYRHCLDRISHYNIWKHPTIYDTWYDHLLRKYLTQWYGDDWLTSTDHPSERSSSRHPSNSTSSTVTRSNYPSYQGNRSSRRKTRKEIEAWEHEKEMWDSMQLDTFDEFSGRMFSYSRFFTAEDEEDPSAEKVNEVIEREFQKKMNSLSFEEIYHQPEQKIWHKIVHVGLFDLNQGVVDLIDTTRRLDQEWMANANQNELDENRNGEKIESVSAVNNNNTRNHRWKEEEEWSNVKPSLVLQSKKKVSIYQIAWNYEFRKKFFTGIYSLFFFCLCSSDIS